MSRFLLVLAYFLVFGHSFFAHSQHIGQLPKASTTHPEPCLEWLGKLFALDLGEHHLEDFRERPHTSVPQPLTVAEVAAYADLVVLPSPICARCVSQRTRPDACRQRAFLEQHRFRGSPLVGC